jgi:hypothetical protein
MALSAELILIEPVTLADILLAIDICPVEISGLARAKQKDGAFLVYGEPEVFFQTCSLGGTEFDMEAQGRWNHMMMSSGRGAEINEFRLWWHSHVFALSAFSATDKELIESWAESSAAWWMSFVGNKFGDMDFRVDTFGKRRCTIHPAVRCTETLPKETLRALMVSRASRMKKIVDERVKFGGKEAFEKILAGVYHER